MRLKDHSTIQSTEQIKPNDIVFVLFNGKICLGLIKKIKSEEAINVQITKGIYCFGIVVNKQSIYSEKPML